MRTRLRYGLAGLALILVGIGAWAAMGHPLPAAVLKALPALSQDASQQPPLGGRSRPERPGEPEFAVGVVEAKMATVPISFDYTGVIVSPQDAGAAATRDGRHHRAALRARWYGQEGPGAVPDRPPALRGGTEKTPRPRASGPRPRWEFAEAEVQRTDTLADKGYATQQRLQQLESNGPRPRARFRRPRPRLPARSSTRLRRDQGAFDGRASLSGINIGDLVTANATNLVSVVQIDPIDVQVALSTDDSKAVRAAMQGGGAALTVLGDDDEPGREAKVYKLDNRFDPATARRLIGAKLANADGLYLPASSSGRVCRSAARSASWCDPRPVGATRPAHRCGASAPIAASACGPSRRVEATAIRPRS